MPLFFPFISPTYANPLVSPWQVPRRSHKSLTYQAIVLPCDSPNSSEQSQHWCACVGGRPADHCNSLTGCVCVQGVNREDLQFFLLHHIICKSAGSFFMFLMCWCFSTFVRNLIKWNTEDNIHDTFKGFQWRKLFLHLITRHSYNLYFEFVAKIKFLSTLTMEEKAIFGGLTRWCHECPSALRQFSML